MRFKLSPVANAAIGIALVAAAAGCATSPVPAEKIAVAKAALQNAEQSGAPELAPLELSQAREKLARAEKAAADHDAQPATQLADQANVDAQLAAATAQEKKSHKAAMEFDASLQALRQETLRNSQPNGQTVQPGSAVVPPSSQLAPSSVPLSQPISPPAQ